MSSEPFQLRNDPPPHRPWRGREPENQQQLVLFAGLNCLPGQQDLFPIDGHTAGDSQATVSVVKINGKTVWENPHYKVWRSDGHWWCGKKRGWLPALRRNVRYHEKWEHHVDAEGMAACLCSGTDYRFVPS